MRLASFLVGLPVAITLVLVGCTSGSDDGAGGSSSTTTTGSGGATKQTITAKQGGTLQSSDGVATLTFPSGSVSQTLEVSVTVLPKASDTATAIYAYTPVDLTISVPAQLVIDIHDVTLPTGKAYALGKQTGSTWAVVPGTTLGSGTINASISALGTFAVIFVDSGPCDASCMSAPGAVCCTACGCTGEVKCMPDCAAPFQWDCELGCCYDYTAHVCEGS